MGASLLRCVRGVAAVEFALAAPLLLTFVLGVADFGLAAAERMRLAAAARAGVQAALADPANLARIRQAVGLADPALAAERLDVQVATACACPDGTAIACAGAVCAAGQSLRYVTVRVAETYPLLLPYPGLGEGLALSAQSTLRY